MSKLHLQGRFIVLGAQVAEEGEALLLLGGQVGFQLLGLGTDLLQVGVFVVERNHSQVGEVELKDLLDLEEVLLLGAVRTRVVVDEERPIVVVTFVPEESEFTREHDFRGTVCMHRVL